jgi:hypothetical protein
MIQHACRRQMIFLPPSYMCMCVCFKCKNSKDGNVFMCYRKTIILKHFVPNSPCFPLKISFLRIIIRWLYNYDAVILLWVCIKKRIIMVGLYYPYISISKFYWINIVSVMNHFNMYHFPLVMKKVFCGITEIDW